MDNTDYQGYIYRERAELVAFASKLYPSRLWLDPDDYEWPVVYIVTPAGQLSWHISRADLDLFAHLGWNGQANTPWDGHSTATATLGPAVPTEGAE
jgi:hypothetical protein